MPASAVPSPALVMLPIDCAAVAGRVRPSSPISIGMPAASVFIIWPCVGTLA